MSRDETFTDEFKVIRRSPSGKAVLLKHEPSKLTEWVPVSQITEPADEEIVTGETQEITLKAWIAREKGFTDAD